MCIPVPEMLPTSIAVRPIFLFVVVRPDNGWLEDESRSRSNTVLMGRLQLLAAGGWRAWVLCYVHMCFVLEKKRGLSALGEWEELEAVIKPVTPTYVGRSVIMKNTHTTSTPQQHHNNHHGCTKLKLTRPHKSVLLFICSDDLIHNSTIPSSFDTSRST